MKIKRFLSIVLLVCISLFATEKQKLVFGVNPNKSTTEIQILYAELISYLEKELEQEVVLVISKDYNHLITLIEQGSIDIASISPKLYAILRQKEPETHYLATIQFADEQSISKSTYRSLILTLADSPIASMSDLKGKSFGFTDPDSTSGYLYPHFMMYQNSIDPTKDLGKIYMLKKHPKIIQALFEKSIEAGAIYDGVYHALPKEEQQKIRILAVSEEIPYDAMIASKRLDSALVVKIRELLLAFHPKQALPSTIAGFEEKPLFLYDHLNTIEY